MNNRIHNHNSWFSSHATAAALVALLVGVSAVSGFAQQPQPKAFAALGDGARSGYAYEKDLSPETKYQAPPIQGKPSSKAHHAKWSQSNQPSKEDWIRCLQNDACHARTVFADDWDKIFGGPVDVTIGD